MDKLEKYIDYMIEILEIDEKMIDCICSINGYNLKTLEDVLYYFTGYHHFDQLEYFADYILSNK